MEDIGKLKNNIECELRGPITWSDFCDLKSSIENEWGKLKHYIELVIFFKGDFDLRLKINNEGVDLTLKKTIKTNEAKTETVVHTNLDQVKNIVELINRLGFSNGLFSYIEKYEAQNQNNSISFKFGSKIGDFFEIEELVGNRKHINSAVSRIKKSASKYDLMLWDQETYKKLLHKSWKDVQLEDIVIGGELNNQIKVVVKKIQSIDSQKSAKNKTTIGNILKKHSNDYSKLEKDFFRQTNCKLVSSQMLSPNLHFTKSVSIVIPSHNSSSTLIRTLNSIKNQDLSPKERSLVEVVVVDDASEDNTGAILSKYEHNFDLKYFRQNHLGRSQARNIGSVIAKGDILMFIDSDIILEKHFIREHAIRHEYLDKVVLISLKENLSSDDTRLNDSTFLDILPMPNISRDFRCEKEVKPEWLRMHRHVRKVEVRKVKILEETNNLKNFGKDKVIGVWDLPSTIVTNAVSIKSSELKAMGGFNLQFKGWGMEDTFLGACLISRGNYIIPLLGTGIYHIEHPPRSGSKDQMLKEFNSNVLAYLELINLPVATVMKEVD